MGWIASPTLIAAQSAAEWQVRGVVTGTNMFARSMGSAVGIAVFGAIANAALIGAAGAGGHGSISLDGVDPLVLFDALHRVFLGLGGGRGRDADRRRPDAAQARRAPARPARLTPPSVACRGGPSNHGLTTRQDG